ncbi:unnamed protein product [Ectocarpus sp. 13 AM-2016]
MSRSITGRGQSTGSKDPIQHSSSSSPKDSGKNVPDKFVCKVEDITSAVTSSIGQTTNDDRSSGVSPVGSTSTEHTVAKGKGKSKETKAVKRSTLVSKKGTAGPNAMSTTSKTASKTTPIPPEKVEHMENQGPATLPDDASPTYTRSATRGVEEAALIINDLVTNGYSVVGGVLSSDDCTQAVDGTWAWLASLGSGIEPSNPKTWVLWPKSFGHGLVQHYGIGQAPFFWEVRMNKNVRGVFESLWGTPDLVTSFDGVCIRRPPEMTRCRHESKKDQPWLHCDQSKQTVGKVPTVNGWQCIQGGVNLEASDEGDACFRVLSGSHTLHASAPWQGTSKDYYALADSEIDWYKSQGCVDTKVTCPKGGMVLWDSRAIHSNTNPVKGRNNPGRFRYTLFVCMIPRSHLSIECAEKRRNAFQENRTASHWPARMTLFGKNPNTYGKEDPCSAPVDVEKNEEWESLV